MTEEKKDERCIATVEMPVELKQAGIDEAIRRGYGNNGFSTLVRVLLTPFLPQNIVETIKQNSDME